MWCNPFNLIKHYFLNCFVIVSLQSQARLPWSRNDETFRFMENKKGEEIFCLLIVCLPFLQYQQR